MATIEDGEAHASISPGCCVQRRKSILVLAGGLADRGADHYLVDLVLAETCLAQRADVRIGHRPGTVRDLLDEMAYRLVEPFVIESCAADLRRCPPLPLEDSSNEGTVQ